MENLQVQEKAYFNDGYLQTRRIGELQQEINKVRHNLTAFNIENNCYNYEVYLSCIKSLLFEINKITPEDEKQASILQKLTEETLLYYPPHKVIVKEGNRKRITVLDSDNWFKCRRILEIFEKATKQLLDTYGLSNPTKEGGDLF